MAKRKYQKSEARILSELNTDKTAARMIEAGWKEIQAITGLSYYDCRNKRGEQVTALRGFLVHIMRAHRFAANVIVRQSGMSSRTVWKYLNNCDLRCLGSDAMHRMVNAIANQKEPQNQQTNAIEKDT